MSKSYKIPKKNYQPTLPYLYLGNTPPSNIRLPILFICIWNIHHDRQKQLIKLKQ